MKRLSFVVIILIILFTITNVTFAPFVGRDSSETPSALKEKIAEQSNKILRLKAEIDKQQKEINMLQNQVSVLTKLCKDANIPMLALEYLKQKNVTRSDIKVRFSYPLSVGQVAYIDEHFPTIQQVIDEKSMLVRLQLNKNDEMVWVRGINTTGFADGSPWKAGDIILKIMGTKQYKSAFGPQVTVFLLEPVEVVD